MERKQPRRAAEVVFALCGARVSHRIEKCSDNNGALDGMVREVYPRLIVDCSRRKEVILLLSRSYRGLRSEETCINGLCLVGCNDNDRIIKAIGGCVCVYSDFKITRLWIIFECCICAHRIVGVPFDTKQ